MILILALLQLHETLYITAHMTLTFITVTSHVTFITSTDPIDIPIITIM